MSSTDRPKQPTGSGGSKDSRGELSRPALAEESAESQQLQWWARTLLGATGLTLAVISIWALLVNGREGAMPTTMILLGALMLLIALVGYLPDRLWAGDSGIQFARRAVRKEIRAAAEAVIDSTPPDQREAVVDELVEEAEPTRDEALDHLAAVRASVEAAWRWRQRGGINEATSTERSLERAWSDALLTATGRARRMEMELRSGLTRAIPQVEAHTHKQLTVSESPSGDVDLEVAWPPNCRILVEAKLTTRSLAALSGIRRKAREEGQRLGLLVLVGGSQSLSSLRHMEARLNDDIGSPVLVRPFEFFNSTLVGDLIELVRAVDGITE